MDLPASFRLDEPLDALTTALDGRWGELRRGVRAQMAATVVRDNSDLTTEQYRQQVFDDLHLLAKTGPARLGFDPEYGGMGDPAASVVAHEMLGFGDLSLMVEAGVQWGPFGGAVRLLGTRRHQLESRAAGIKAVATWHATATIQACREACGGAGYLAENLLTTLKADTDVFTTFEGDNTVLLQLVAKGLLTNYQSQVEDLGTLATARFIAEQFAGAFIERTAARSVIEPLLAARPHAQALVDSFAIPRTYLGATILAGPAAKLISRLLDAGQLVGGRLPFHIRGRDDGERLGRHLQDVPGVGHLGRGQQDLPDRPVQADVVDLAAQVARHPQGPPVQHQPASARPGFHREFVEPWVGQRRMLVP